MGFDGVHGGNGCGGHQLNLLAVEFRLPHASCLLMLPANWVRTTCFVLLLWLLLLLLLLTFH